MNIPRLGTIPWIAVFLACQLSAQSRLQFAAGDPAEALYEAKKWQQAAQAFAAIAVEDGTNSYASFRAGQSAS